MTDFDLLKEKCDYGSRMREIVIDDSFKRYIVEKDDLIREFHKKMTPYRQVVKMNADPAHWEDLLMGQYVLHRVFKAGGLLKKYLRQYEVTRRPLEQQEFLKQQVETPWRFSYAVVMATPAPDFYQMKDVFTGDSLLVYSPSITQILGKQTVTLWFNLITFNGACWQTYSAISAYHDFDLDDIFFFATEVNPRVDSDESLLEDVERNPLPYMLVNSGSGAPGIMVNDDEFRINSAQYPIESFDKDKFKRTFHIEDSQGVFRLSFKDGHEPPDKAAAYIDEVAEELVIVTKTDKTFSTLVTMLKACGLDIDTEPHIRVHPTLLVTAERILKRNVWRTVDPYEALFPATTTPEAKDDLKRLNVFLDGVTAAYNSGKSPDIEVLADEAGLDLDEAREITTDALRRLDEINKPKQPRVKKTTGGKK